MNAKQRKTLEAIYKDPVSPAIAWADVEALFIALGCRCVEGRGSRVRFEKDGMIASFHRPHPDRHAKRYQVRDARMFLKELGIEP